MVTVGIAEINQWEQRIPKSWQSTKIKNGVKG